MPVDGIFLPTLYSHMQVHELMNSAPAKGDKHYRYVGIRFTSFSASPDIATRISSTTEGSSVSLIIVYHIAWRHVIYNLSQDHSIIF